MGYITVFSFFDDEFRSPVYVNDIVATVIKLIDNRTAGEHINL